MLSLIALLCLAGAVVLLVILSIIDLRVRLLPNELVLGFATLGAIFHFTTLGADPVDIALGILAGFGLLYAIRAAANAYYQQDALGLGDVKLMGAAGLWLGLEGTLFALTLGAFAGLIHGLLYGLYIAWKDQTPLNLSRLTIPAGPGFAVGIVAVGAWKYRHFVMDTLHGFGA